jgi:hypothetical protein
MLSKPHDASARSADKRTALAAAVAGLLAALAFAGQAGADVPMAGAPSSVTTPAIQSVASTGQNVAAAQPGKDLPQAAGDVVAPAVRTATQSTGSVVAPATKVVTQGVGSATRAAGDVVAPAVRTATQSTGSVVAPATKVVTQGLGSATRAAGDVVAPAVRTATQSTGSVVAPATKVVTQGVGSATRAIAATTHAASDTLAPVPSSPSSSPPLSAAPSSLRVEVPGLPLGGGQSSRGTGEPVLPGSRSILPLGVASTALASLVGLLAGLPSGAAHNGSPPASIPSSPGPGPGGVSESTVAACGFALSIFLTLAGLPMLAAPRAMRRLRLASEPWRLAPFVLIPERPG